MIHGLIFFYNFYLNTGELTMIADHFADSVDTRRSPLTPVLMQGRVQFDSVIEEAEVDSSSAFVVCNDTLQITLTDQGDCHTANLYEETHGENNSATSQFCNTATRARRKKRPFSPELIGHDMRNSARGKRKRKATRNSHVHGAEINSFSCDKCGAQSIVDPSRRRLAPDQVKKAPSIRRRVDPETRKLLTLCNACGLAFSRPPKKEKQIIISTDGRDKYLAEAMAFAKSIAERVAKPAVERLYCPSFKNRPCGCLQTYLSHQGEGEDALESKVERLLQIFRTACDLHRRRNLFPEYKDSELKNNDLISNQSERKQRQRDYEHFVLETRQILREKLRLCERACQRILLYSNNFLHKRLKSSDQCSRISKQPGHNTTVQLKSIKELGTLTCCSDNCSRLALTHSMLLEEWRKQASLGQRQARRVLAEMLTPSGGTKANCYKFISMVTGCGPSTISSVSHQMRITKGNREPPEHGLKKWHRVKPRRVEKTQEVSICSQKQGESSNASSADLDQKPKDLIELQRKELEEAKRLLHLQQLELDQCRQIIDQHLQQQTHSVESSSSNPLWKVNIIRSTLAEEESSTQLINLPVEPNVTMLPHISNGQTIQFIDLVPGTYIAVPSTYDSSAVLTVTPDSRETTVNSDSFPTEIFPEQQEIIFPDTLNSLSSPCKSNSMYIHSDNDGQTIYKVPSVSEDANAMLNRTPSQMQALEDSSEVYASASGLCNDVTFSTSNINQQPVPSFSAEALESLGSSGSSLRPLEGDSEESSFQETVTSCRTSVITPAKTVVSIQTIPNSEGSAAAHPSLIGNPMMKCPKTGECGENFEMSSVILLSQHETQPSGNSLSSLDQFFD